MPYATRSLDPTTWVAFEELVVRNNGPLAAGWCMGGYPEGLARTDPEVNRANKYRRVHRGGAHAALVFDEQGLAQMVPIRRPRGASACQAPPRL